jgi:hypothetical protein
MPHSRTLPFSRRPRHLQDTNYARISKAEITFFAERRAIGLLPLYTYLKLLTWAGVPEEFPSRKEIADALGLGIDAIRVQLLRLVDLGAVDMEPGTGRSNSTYSISPEFASYAHPRAGENTTPARGFDQSLGQSEGARHIKEYEHSLEETHTPGASARDLDQVETQLPSADRLLSRDMREKLLSSGLELSEAQLRKLACYAGESIDTALACLRSHHGPDNPVAFFLAALKYHYVPPARARSTAPAQSEQAAVSERSAGVADLVRAFALVPGQSHEAVAAELERDLTRLMTPLEDRVASWAEAGRSAEWARTVESQFDERIRAARQTTQTCPGWEVLMPYFPPSFVKAMCDYQTAMLEAFDRTNPTFLGQLTG